jgi:predicted XRE-type DNA-binding protein
MKREHDDINARVVPSSGNVFADLGLPAQEKDMLKVQIAMAISAAIEKRKLTQVEAAKIVNADQSKISALLRGRLKDFSVERLIQFLFPHMAEKPIIFSGPMVKAILEGRKTQTRRIIKHPPEADLIYSPKGSDLWLWTDGDGGSGTVLLPYAVGDVLWVREAFATVGNVDPPWLLYRASGYEAECRRHGFDNPPPESSVKWKPSIHMPRWASRISLKVNAVKVERLNDISEEDARAEGVERPHWPSQPYRSAFRGIWQDIHGPDAWEKNPWVAAISFARQ